MQKAWLIAGICFNIALLIFFKYSDFLIWNFNFTFDTKIPFLHMILPLAISFFTFQQIAYLVDTHKGYVKEQNFIKYATFVTFFPQLIAGPIVHHKEMMPQFYNTKNNQLRWKYFSLGLMVFSIGLFKKVVLADSFAIYANAGFDEAVKLTLIEAWVASLSYTFQLYFDFSGYADMAIGSALFFNIKLPINFNAPYRALNIQEFWRKWHITLSRFLRDYLYIPLGGNRVHSTRLYINLLIVFLIGGIWHGAGWTFLFWGFLHGAATIIFLLWKRFDIGLPRPLSWFITFNFVNITWVFFRANSWEDAMKVLSGMFSTELKLDPTLAHLLNGITSFEYFKFYPQGELSYTISSILLICVGFFIVLHLRSTTDIYTKVWKPNILQAILSAILFFGAILVMHDAGYQSEFLYFQF
jgi:D-alanyl-lipoteichoic acid acyltransferase DltB (MBOAT superfamily)